jgi:hypothetical protein
MWYGGVVCVHRIAAVRFHAAGQVLLTAGADKYLRFFRIDGDKNEKQLGKCNVNVVCNAQSYCTRTAATALGVVL